MRKVTSLDEYYALVKAAKKDRKAALSNCFLFPDAIQRFIDLGRFYCEEQDAGVLFYSDEEKYYECYYYLNPETALHIEKKDKPIVLQNMRTGTEKKARLLLLEQRLGEAGFAYADTMRQIRGDAEKNLAKIGKIAAFAKLELERDGFSVINISEKWFPAVRELLANTPEIPYYTIQYFSEEELKAQCRDGLVLGVVSSEGELCAVQRYFVEGKTLFGWVAVKEAYKQTYGMALVMSEQLLKTTIDRGYNPVGWIDVNNEPSIKYHLRKGYQFTDRYVDRWIL